MHQDAPYFIILLCPGAKLATFNWGCLLVCPAKCDDALPENFLPTGGGGGGRRSPKKFSVSVPFKGLKNFFRTVKIKGQKIFFGHWESKNFFWTNSFHNLPGTHILRPFCKILVYNTLKLLNNSTFYHLKYFIALKIQMICPADPDDLPCQSSFGGVSHPPTHPLKFRP